MAFHDRQYKAFVVLGDPASEPLWHWNRWSDFAAMLDPIFAACRGKALVRCSQFEADSRTEIKFGRLVWSAESQAKWVHGSTANAEASKHWSFFFAEASAPSLPSCSRRGEPPDFFFVLRNEAFPPRKIALAFSQRIFMAVATDLPDALGERVLETVKTAANMVAARLVVTIKRPWGYSFGSGSGFTSAIQDIAHGGLFKVGQPHTRPVDLSTFAEQWQVL